MRKRSGIAMLLIITIIVFSVGVTMAFLATSSRPVINTFTVGNIQLTLTETTGTAYQLIPGTTVNKDPSLTVKAYSDACWLFFKITASMELDDCVTYTPAAGWTPLPGAAGVYYRLVNRMDADVTFPLLQGNVIQIRDTLTEEQIAALHTAPTMAFTGYAIQTYGIASAEDAWQQLIDEGVTGG